MEVVDDIDDLLNDLDSTLAEPPRPAARAVPSARAIPSAAPTVGGARRKCLQVLVDILGARVLATIAVDSISPGDRSKEPCLPIANARARTRTRKCEY